MTNRHPSRRTVLAVGASGAIAAAAAIGALAPWRSRNAEAQVDPALTGTELPPEHYDPALVGADPALAAPDAMLTVPATPVVTPESSIPSPTWEPTEAGMTTSLGGSDVAVASVGESNQVDGPKRKTNKIMGGKKRP